MVQEVKDPALSLQQLGSLLWHKFGLRISTCHRCGQKKKIFPVYKVSLCKKEYAWPLVFLLMKRYLSWQAHNLIWWATKEIPHVRPTRVTTDLKLHSPIISILLFLILPILQLKKWRFPEKNSFSKSNRTRTVSKTCVPSHYTKRKASKK